MFEGTTDAATRSGVGHYTVTPLPCEQGNVGIAGNRTTYTRPFYDLDRLLPGDRLVVTVGDHTCTYSVVQKPFVVAPSDFNVLDQRIAKDDRHLLTLTTAHPKGSAAQRLVVRLEQVS
jgi:sortase A